MNDILQKAKDTQAQYSEKIGNSLDEKNLDIIYLELFSKKQGLITEMMKALASLSIEEKKQLGPELNTLQIDLKTAINNRKSELKNNIVQDPRIDLSYPENPVSTGMLHPTTQIIRQMNEYFRYNGFSIYEGPEIETEEYNFRRLNLPKGHPATDLQDTLYIKDEYLLRTHTSSIEARVLEEHKPPIRVVCPGKSYRNETPNATNDSFFHQYQGVVVDKNITLQHLKGTLEGLHKFLFGDDIKLRYRYKYYPEVSPGMGVDMQCKFCAGKGCGVCKERGWIEVLGSGMIHYNTLKASGINPEEYTGYAFGMGLDRLVMQRFEIDDIRKLYGGIVYK